MTLGDINNDDSFLVALSALSAYSNNAIYNTTSFNQSSSLINIIPTVTTEMYHQHSISAVEKVSLPAASSSLPASAPVSSLPTAALLPASLLPATSSVSLPVSSKVSSSLKRVNSSNNFSTIGEATQSVIFSSRMSYSASSSSDSEDSDYGGHTTDSSTSNSSNGASRTKLDTSTLNKVATAPSSIAMKKRRVENDVQLESIPYCVSVAPVAQLPVLSPLKCQFHKCNQMSVKSTPFCGRHIGIKQCAFDGCNKCAQGSTAFCISHGGGRRCNIAGCMKSARDRKFCASHGGGKRCRVDFCSKSAVGGSNSCTLHGGGKKCTFENCSKSAQSPSSFCVRHGGSAFYYYNYYLHYYHHHHYYLGGRKCKFDNCSKVARGKTLFCASHTVSNASQIQAEVREIDIESEIVNRLIHLHKEINPTTYTLA